MQTKKVLLLFFIVLLLTGCTSQGIHLYTIRFVGEVRESSVLQQPIKGVEILTSTGEQLGITDAEGRFNFQVTVRQGKTQLLLQHPDYQQAMVEQSIDGSYQTVISLPPLYLTPAGREIRGRVLRKIPKPGNRAEEIVLPVSQMTLPEMDVVEREYNLVTHNGKEWLINQLAGRGEIVSVGMTADRYTVRLHSKEDEKEFLQELTLLENVEYIEPNCYVYLQGLVSEDEYLPELWNMQMIGAPAAWLQATGLGVKVAVLDSLFMSEHPDLRTNLLSPRDVYGNVFDDQVLGRHGTHVAGIIGAVADQDGVIGVAPFASILPIRVFKWDEFGRESATVDAISEGIYLAIEEGVQVINMSFGMNNYNQTLHDAVKSAYAAGIVLVAAAGNNGGSQMLYPAAFPEVIGVGSVGPDEKRANYSQYGPGIELMAPGGNKQLGENAMIYSTVWDSMFNRYTWGYEQGTSMAAPHVSGLVALLISYGITDPDYIRLILRETAKDLGASGYDEETGYGLIDAAKVMGLFQYSYVFFGSVEAGHAEVRSPVVQVAVNGEYTLNGVRDGAGQVIGWIDINQNYRIDAGDYLGQSDLVEDVVTDAQLSGVDVTLARVEGDFQAIDIEALLSR